MASGRLSSLRAQATGPAPFLLEDGDVVITVPPPDADRLDQMLTLPPSSGRLVELVALCGPAAAADLMAATAEDDAIVLEVIVEDIQTHFAVHNAPRLGWLLDRYGDHIQADLRERGVDVLDLWRGRITVDEVANLVDHLPRTSHFADAYAHDDELAAARPPRDRRPQPPRFTEFGPEVELLAAVVDRLGEVANAVVQSAGGKHQQVKAWPRPVTAADRVEAERRRQGANQLLSQLYPEPTD